MALPAAASILVLVALTMITGRTGADIPGNITVVVDGYRFSSALESPAQVRIGSTFVLECNVAGLPHNSPILYNWTYPRRLAPITGYSNVAPGDASWRTLRVSVLGEDDAGVYTCTATLADQLARVLRGTFQVTVKGGAVLLNNRGTISNNLAITDTTSIQPKHRSLRIGTFNISTIFCLAPRNSFPRFVRIKPGDRIGSTGEYSGDAAGSGIPLMGSLKQGKSHRAAVLLVPPDTSSVENVKVCCLASTARACTYLWLQPPADTEDGSLNITLKNDKILQIDEPKNMTKGRVNLTYLVTLQNTMTSLKRTFTMKHSTTSIGPLFPGAEYNVSVREYWFENGTMQYSPTSKHLQVSSKAPQVHNEIKASNWSPRMLSVSRVLAGGFEVHWLPPRHFTPSHYVVNCTANGTIITSHTMQHKPGSNYRNITGLPPGEYYIEVFAYLGGVKVGSQYTYSYEPSKTPGVQSSSSFDSLYVTLPIIAVLVGLIIIMTVVLLVRQIKVFRAKKKKSIEAKKPPPDATVEDVYERFNWSNVTPTTGPGVMQNQYISTAPRSSIRT